MNKLKVFSVFLLMHVLAWAAAHWYLSSNPERVLVVVDTSYAMQEKFPQMQSWIESYEASSRYREVIIGTDKARIGPLAELRSKSVIFRTVFGRMNEDSLKRYAAADVSEKILLSDGSVRPGEWTIVVF
ncbi:MAG: hypothetical protein AB8B63_15685 [Granulosicoccus sp.]